MPVEVQLIMPKFGMGMVEGLIVEWFKKEGERVQKGEAVLVIETDKVTVEVEAPWTGVLQKVIAPKGKEVPCGNSVGVLVTDEEVGRREVPLSGKPRKGRTPGPTPTIVAPVTMTGPSAAPATNLDISPIALKIATERGVDVARIKGTGPGGRITKEDVLLAAEWGPAGEEVQSKLEPLEVIPLRGIRKTISERMHMSRQTAAHFTLSMEVDMTEAVKLREELLKAGEPAITRPTLNDMIVMATARALAEHRGLNCSVVGNEIRHWKQVNVGVAVATERGLIVPVIRDADKKSLDEISQVARDLVERAREGALDFDDVSEGTFTVTNMGALGVEIFTPIINPPESAILGVGRVIKKPVVVDGEVTVRSMMYLSLSIDHRIIDGAAGAQFLGTIKGLLEQPDWIGRGADGQV